VNIGPSNRLWPAACQTLNVPELIHDARFETSTLRVHNHKELSRLLQLEFLKRPSNEWIDAFQLAGIPVGPIKNVAEILDDPHVHAREMVVEVDHPVIGRMKTLGVPIKLSETPGAVTRAAPTLGQHSDEILCELGYSPAEIADLHAAHVV
jgi:formyl-CoA transferase